MSDLSATNDQIFDQMDVDRRWLKWRWLLLALAILCFLSLMISVMIGYHSIFLVPSRIWAVVSGDENTSKLEKIATNFRLSRAIMAFLVGGALAMSGALLQALYRNPLAEPSLTGVTQGATTAVVVFAVFGPTIPNHLVIYSVPFIAILGAIISTTITWFLANRVGKVEPLRLILMGVLVGGVLSSATIVSLIWAPDTYANDLIAWLAGSLSATTWEDVKMLSIALLFLTPFVFMSVPRANLMQFGDDIASGLGQSINPGRILVLFTACALTAVAVATVGGIGFVGLMVPHSLRWFVGGDLRRLVPACFLLGGALVMVTDFIARNLSSKILSEMTGLPMDSVTLPVGIYLSLLGGGFFLFILRKVKT